MTSWLEYKERLAEAERYALEELARRFESGELPVRPGRYVVTVEETVTSP